MRQQYVMNSTISDPKSDSLLAIALMASFADGDKSEAERTEIQKIATDLGSDNLPALTRSILMGKRTLEELVAPLTTPTDKLLGYEMARAVCEADGVLRPDESEFLTELRSKLGLSAEETDTVDSEVDAFALAPITDPSVPPPPPDVAPENSGMVLRYAILNGALEILPETMATVAIIPLQLKMVYRIGKSHGVELSKASIVEFLATAGVGMGSQVAEGFARKLFKGFGKKLGGKLGGRAGDQLAGSAFSFASTYAIGHLADRYYGSGRSLGSDEPKAVFNSLQEQAKSLHGKYLPEIKERARTLDPSSVLSLVRGGGNV